MERNIALLSNSLAGVGRSLELTGNIIQLLTERKIRCQEFRDQWPSQWEGITDCWIIGGDGTLNQFVNRYPDLQLPLAVFNGGTGNDFHWLLYGNCTWPEQVDKVLQSEPRPIDLGRCNDRYFLNDVGIGFEGAVARSLQGKKKKPGKTSFFLTVIRKIFWYRSSAYHLTVDGQVWDSRRYLLVDINNGCRAGGGFHIAPTSRADDGWFDLVAIDAVSVLQRLRWLPVIEKGRHLHLPFVHHLKAKRIVVAGKDPMYAHLDGECYTAERMEIELLPGRLRFCY